MDSSVGQYAVLAVLLCGLGQKVSAAGSIAWDTGCGSTKGCFPDCTGGCDYLVTWSDTGSAVTFTMQVEETSSAVYFAIGFSDDYRMDDDSVVGCIPAGSTVYSYYNEGLSTATLSPATLALSGTSVSLSNGVISCSFTRDYTAGDSRVFDLTSDYYIMLVVGEAESEGGSSYKLEKHYMIPWFSDSRVDFQSNSIVGAYKLNSPLVKLHGIMSVLGWLLFSLIGMLAARYNRDTLPETKIFGAKVWFQAHRGLMIGVVVALVIGFIAIFVEIEGYSQISPPQDEGYTTSHPVLGIIVTVLAILNPIAAFVRPGPEHKYRWVFNWGHRLLGLVTQFLAVLTVFFGYILDRSVLSNSAVIVTGIQVLFVVLFVIALELHMRFYSKKSGSVNIAMEPEKKDGEEMEEEKKKPLDDDKGQQSNLPLIGLLVFSVVMFGFAMGALGIIAAG